MALPALSGLENGENIVIDEYGSGCTKPRELLSQPLGWRMALLMSDSNAPGIVRRKRRFNRGVLQAHNTVRPHLSSRPGVAEEDDGVVWYREEYYRLFGGKPPQFVPGFERNSPVAPSDFHRITAGYRLIYGDINRLTQTS